MKIGIVGLGTIGGSFAKTIKSHTDHEVYGADADPDAIAFAHFTDLIDGELGEARLPSLDLLLLAIYPQDAVAYLRKASPRLKKSCVVLDCCGVKRAVFPAFCAEAEAHGFRFVGGHPMAGAVASGFRASREKMFKGASMVLIPGANADLATLDMLCALFRSLGFSRIVTATPEQHDRMIAFTSQLPHVLSNAYVKSPSARDHRGFSAGSYRDMARVAGLNIPMWTELFLDNADYLTDELDTLLANLTAYRDALANRDAETLTALLQAGNDCKAAADASEYADG